MKKLVLTSMAIVALSTFLFYGCNKDETNATPTVTLNGSSSVISTLNAIYIDSGAVATDPEDGKLIVVSDLSATNPNVDLAGTYTITYTATDAGGNVGKATRTVEVRNDLYNVAGNYNTNEAPSGNAWSQSISASTTQNNYIVFGKFADYSNNNAITAKVIVVSGEKYVYITPSPQQADGIGLDGCNHLFKDGGAGSKLQQVGGKWTFTVKFTDEITGGGVGCTASGAQPYEDTFSQN